MCSSSPAQLNWSYRNVTQRGVVISLAVAAQKRVKAELENPKV